MKLIILTLFAILALAMANPAAYSEPEPAPAPVPEAEAAPVADADAAPEIEARQAIQCQVTGRPGLNVCFARFPLLFPHPPPRQPKSCQCHSLTHNHY